MPRARYGFSQIQEMQSFKRYLSLEEVRAAGGFSFDQLDRLPMNSAFNTSLPGPWTGIYFIWATRCNVIKIGKAKHVGNRMAALQSGSPDDLRLMWCYAAPAAHELELHSQFRDGRSHGEWFHATPPLLGYIKQKIPGLYRPSESRKKVAA